MWFFKLIGPGSLYDRYGDEFLNDKMIICHQLEYRKFNFIHDIHELINMMGETSPFERCYYEVIPATKPCKPFFDLDINDVDMQKNHIDILNDVLKSIISISNANQWPITLRDITICESHSATKKSYHITINSFHVDSIRKLKHLCPMLVSEVSDKFKKYVDLGIYNHHRQFRILSNTKYGEERFKKWSRNNSIKLENDNRGFLTGLMRTLITIIDDSSKLIDIEIPNEIDKYEINDETVRACMCMLNDDNFTVSNVKDNIICLRRKRPSYCVVCERVHEHENPYLVIIDERVLFCCRRTDKHLLLGNLMFMDLNQHHDTEQEGMEILNLDPEQFREQIKEAMSKMIF